MKKPAPFLFAILLFIIVFSPPSAGENPPFPDSSFARIDDVSLHYRLRMPEDEPLKSPVLLIHGLGGSTYCWRENQEALAAAGHPTVAVDLPAFGYSSREAGLDHSQKSRAELLWGLINYLAGRYPDLRGSWNLAGHSMGAGTVAAMALDNPEGVRSMIFIGGAIYNSPPELAGQALDLWPVDQIFSLAAENIFFREWILERALRSAYGREITTEEIEGYLTPLKLEGTGKSWADLVRTSSREEPAGLETLEIPSLLIWGEEDTWVPLEDGLKLKWDLPQASLKLIPESHHMPMVTHAEEVNPALIEFLHNPDKY